MEVTLTYKEGFEAKYENVTNVFESATAITITYDILDEQGFICSERKHKVKLNQLTKAEIKCEVNNDNL